MRRVLAKLINMTALVVMVLAAITPILAQLVSAQSTSPWFDGDPELVNEFKLISNEGYREMRGKKIGASAGLNCVEKRISKREIFSINIQYENSCWYSTKIGLISQYGDYLLQPGTGVAGKVRYDIADSRKWPVIMPTPNENVFLELVPSPALDGYYLSFRELKDFKIDRKSNTFGDVSLTLTTPPTKTVLGPSENHLKIHPDDISWSADARYMIVYPKNGHLTRYNMSNFKRMSLQLSDNPTGNLARGSATISPSGRYVAAIEERLNGNIYIADLENCDRYEEDVPVKASNCTKKSLLSVIKAGIPNYSRSVLPRFFGEHTLGFYSSLGTTPASFELRYLQAYGTEFENNGYLALGDSFSSGEGAGDYILGTDVMDINMCHTSTNSYPYVVNGVLSFTDFFSGACSGAEIKDYWERKSQEYDDASSGRPGTTKQKSLITDYHPRVVTISMSGNDIGFSKKLEYCLVWSRNCYNTYEQRKEIANEIIAQNPRLVEMYRDIISEGKNRRLYVLGYPHLFNSDVDAKCGHNVIFNAYQRSMANDLVTYFNAVIKNAAKQAGAIYVGTEGSLNGHRLCDDVSAATAINGLTAGDETGPFGLRLISNGSFHPNKLGHQLFANTLLSTTNQLTKEPEDPEFEDIPDPDNYPFLDIPSSGGIIHEIRYSELFDNNFLYYGLKYNFILNHPLNSFIGNSLVEVWLHSEPKLLLETTADKLGYVEASITIPSDIEPGMHEIRVDGIGDDGKPLSVRQFIYVGVNEEDFDGDGTLNHQEPCGIINELGIDLDEDGIDDACDGSVIPKEDNIDKELDSETNDTEDATTTRLQNESKPKTQIDSPLGYVLKESDIIDSLGSISEQGKNNVQEETESAQTNTSNGFWYFLAITLALIVGYSVINHVASKKE